MFFHRDVSGNMEISQHAVRMCHSGTEDHLHEKCLISIEGQVVSI